MRLRTLSVIVAGSLVVTASHVDAQNLFKVPELVPSSPAFVFRRSRSVRRGRVRTNHSSCAARPRGFSSSCRAEEWFRRHQRSTRNSSRARQTTRSTRCAPCLLRRACRRTQRHYRLSRL